MNMPPERPQRAGRPARGESSPDEPLGTVGGGLLALLRSKGLREVVEIVVIAFSLALPFRTFEAEVFVIPTGSMATTLLGRHCDVICPKCHFHYCISASLEMTNESEERVGDVVAGTCPMCGYTACVNPGWAPYIEQDAHQDRVFNSTAAPSRDAVVRNGDRILVSKFAYYLREPQRWNVFVFRFPGMAWKNYIKRLIGLPGETMRIYRGDIYTGPYDPRAFAQPGVIPYHIQRKPPDKILAMMQLVYDNDYVLDELTRKGWPTCWTPWPRRQDAAAAPGDWHTSDAARTFNTDGSLTGTVWLRYQHLVPSFDNWEDMLQVDHLSPEFRRAIKPQLITDSCAYNSSAAYVVNTKNPQDYSSGPMSQGAYDASHLEFSDSTFLGLHWVRDLILECDLTVDKPSGEVVLELVAGGVPFRCRLDLGSGRATLSIAGDGEKRTFAAAAPQADEHPNGVARELSADTPVKAAGTYRLRFANVDRQLHLWVNGQVIHFPMQATYDDLGNDIPRSDRDGGLDLAPAGIGASAAAVRVAHIRLYRDIYYIAVKWEDGGSGPYMDFIQNEDEDALPPGLTRALRDPRVMSPDYERERARFLSNPDLWPVAFRHLRQVAFPLAKKSDPQKDQFMALGDNSPQSSDGRIWMVRPLGATSHSMLNREYFVERELLIGKALMILWPFDRWKFVR